MTVTGDGNSENAEVTAASVPVDSWEWQERAAQDFVAARIGTVA